MTAPSWFANGERRAISGPTLTTLSPLGAAALHPLGKSWGLAVLRGLERVARRGAGLGSPRAWLRAAAGRGRTRGPSSSERPGRSRRYADVCASPNWPRSPGLRWGRWASGWPRPRAHRFDRLAHRRLALLAQPALSRALIARDPWL